MLDLMDKTMWNYIIKDIGKEMEYLPYAIFLGLLTYFAMKIILPESSKKSHYVTKVLFLIYLFALVNITLFEREAGSRTAVSLTLFETLGSSRNNAYVIENVFLFVPFGFFSAVLLKPLRGLILSLAAGAFCSLLIETVQLVTQRGYFQVDDILMNSIGAAAGCICFRLTAGICRAGRSVIAKWRGSVRI